jgi:hypothetical protein
VHWLARCQLHAPADAGGRVCRIERVGSGVDVAHLVHLQYSGSTCISLGLA